MIWDNFVVNILRFDRKYAANEDVRFVCRFCHFNFILVQYTNISIGRYIYDGSRDSLQIFKASNFKIVHLAFFIIISYVNICVSGFYDKQQIHFSMKIIWNQTSYSKSLIVEVSTWTQVDYTWQNQFNVVHMHLC